MSIGMMCVWIMQLVTSFTFPLLVSWIGDGDDNRGTGAMFFVYASMTMVGVVWMSLHMPETKGLKYEQIVAAMERM